MLKLYKNDNITLNSITKVATHLIRQETAELRAELGADFILLKMSMVIIAV